MLLLPGASLNKSSCTPLLQQLSQIRIAELHEEEVGELILLHPYQTNDVLVVAQLEVKLSRKNGTWISRSNCVCTSVIISIL